MNHKIEKLLTRACKYVHQGEMGLALQEYIQLHQLEPEDTTIINTIADLFAKTENTEQALLWYQKLADGFEARELYSNAAAAYGKILKLAPGHQTAGLRAAELSRLLGTGARPGGTRQQVGFGRS